jgi:hypothetical protein
MRKVSIRFGQVKVYHEELVTLSMLDCDKIVTVDLEYEEIPKADGLMVDKETIFLDAIHHLDEKFGAGRMVLYEIRVDHATIAGTPRTNCVVSGGVFDAM